MAAVTATVKDPFVVEGNIKFRAVDITNNINNNDTYTTTEFTTLLGWTFTPDASGQTFGLSVTGLVVTFKVSGAIKGRLLLWGL